MTVTEFLEARIAEDEALAQAAMDDDTGHDGGFEDAFERLTAGPDKAGALAFVPRFGEAAARMIVWNTPRRVFAECAAKRAILENQRAHVPGERGYGAASYAVVCLAAAYKDHPDYRREWMQ